MSSAAAAGEVVIFLGPSLSHREAQQILPARYMPPARKGDVYRCLPTAGTIILIDGVFHSVPSVWQRELLEALEEGIRVLGASSMGALRAAELHTLGMEGRGTIFEWFRDGVLDGDDEVALLHGPEESGYAALSEPLVNIRYNLARAAERGCLSAEQAAALIAEAKSTYYPKRSYPALLSGSCAAAWPEGTVAKLRAFLDAERVDLKRQDALRVLKEFAEEQGASPDAGAMSSARRARAGYLRDDRERLFQRPLLGRETGRALLESLSAQRREEAVRPLRRRWFLRDWARLRGACLPSAEREKFVASFRERRRIQDLAAWLRARGLTRGEYEEAMGELALEDWLLRQGPPAFGVVDFLDDWAEGYGIRLPPQPSGSLPQWLLEVGPEKFGFDFDVDVALLRDLQLAEGLKQ